MRNQAFLRIQVKGYDLPAEDGRWARVLSGHHPLVGALLRRHAHPSKVKLHHPIQLILELGPSAPTLANILCRQGDIEQVELAVWRSDPDGKDGRFHSVLLEGVHIHSLRLRMPDTRQEPSAPLGLELSLTYDKITWTHEPGYIQVWDIVRDKTGGQIPSGEPMANDEEAEEEPEDPHTVRLSNLKIDAELGSAGYHQDVPASVDVYLPPEHADLNRISFTVTACNERGEDEVFHGEAFQKDGKAQFKLPLYTSHKLAPGGDWPDYLDYTVQADHTYAAQPAQSRKFRVTRPAERLIDSDVLAGAHFDRDNSFILPSCLDSLKQLEGKLKLWRECYPDAHLVLFGHADGDEKKGKALSERRGRSVYAFITNDTEAWEELFQQEHWGPKRLQLILQDLGFYPGAPNGHEDARHREAVKTFQEKVGLKPDGLAGPRTRHALFQAYMGAMHNIDLPGKVFEKFGAMPYMGCGAMNPVQAGGGEGNRRATFGLVKTSKHFPLQAPCGIGDEGACKRQAAREGKRRTEGFRCKFYDSLLVETQPSRHSVSNQMNSRSNHPPWLQIALNEAIRWKGATEDVITKTINYHHEVSAPGELKDLVGTGHAWCASFVNYCLKMSGFLMSNPPYRARSFLEDQNFICLEKPLFGSIAIVGHHHASFAYSVDPSTYHPVLLGGNQSDQINFSSFSEHITYLIPREYQIRRNHMLGLPTRSAFELNAEFGITMHRKHEDITR